jgi:hypothetical protein
VVTHGNVLLKLDSFTVVCKRMDLFLYTYDVIYVGEHHVLKVVVVATHPHLFKPKAWHPDLSTARHAC